MEQLRPQSRTSYSWRWSRMHPLPNSATARPIAADLMAGVLPAGMLQQDEIILLLVKPSLWYILLTSIRTMLIIVLTGILILQYLPSASLPYLSTKTVATLTTLAAMLRLGWGFCVWTSHVYLLTNQRIVTIKGVLNVTIFQTNLRRVQSTKVSYLLIERILGLGSIGFSTAAAAGSPESTWVMIPHPLETQQQIIAAINKASPPSP